MAANKRMFSSDIVGSDSFLEMPTSSQSLYFHLGMRCDDDGFVNPNVTMRMTGANKNDLDILIVKRFILAFKNGVVVIKHHRINNNWDSRDCKRTLYTEEFRQLFLKENNGYTLDEEQGIPVDEKYFVSKRILLPDGNPTETRRQNRIDKNRIDKNREDIDVAKATTPSKFIKPELKEVEEYCKERQNGIDPQHFLDYYNSNGWKVGKNPMKNWKAAIGTWERNGFSKQKTGSGKAIDLNNKEEVDKLLNNK